MAAAALVVSPQARLSYLALYAVSRRTFTSSARRASAGQFNRSDFGGQPFTGIYEPGQPTRGPLGGASMVGASPITPRMLKQHLDQFVVGQERAKKVLCAAVYNHYQRIQELQRQDEEQEELLEQEERRQMSMRHPVEEDEFPGQQSTTPLHPPEPDPPDLSSFPSNPLHDPSPLQLEKSNILLLGPSGVGKTLLAKTLARVLDVPFSMSDCTPFTQAGYIGEDADVCVQRLLAAANYDVAAAERGVICLDEIDKIATAKVSHGKDVSGEGVQQALLKIVEGTTLQIQAKAERNSGQGRNNNASPYSNQGGFPNPMGGMGGMGQQQVPPGKGEIYNVRTDNILFIFTGAFIGLNKMILNRISKGSIGFGAPVRASNPEGGSQHDTTLRGEDALLRKHLPFFSPEPPAVFSPNNPISPREQMTDKKKELATYNTLDLVEPSDLQTYGLIPELIGRIPVSCALSSLDIQALIRVLTEPRNSLLRQYEHLFSLSSIELRFTSGALHTIAKTALNMGTGARGLRTVMERLLGESMFECPGSGVKHVLISERVARKEQAPIYFGRGQQAKFHSMIAEEEEAWEAQLQEQEGNGKGSNAREAGRVEPQVQSFEEYRQKQSAAGFV